MIELTEQQRLAVKRGETIRVTTPELGEDVVLMSAAQYESMREALQDKETQQAVLRYSMRQATAAARENPY
jgi:PHD/YefM family antitoxin component YafN of YafNO toxin-antitoxin module